VSPSNTPVIVVGALTCSRSANRVVTEKLRSDSTGVKGTDVESRMTSPSIRSRPSPMERCFARQPKMSPMKSPFVRGTPFWRRIAYADVTWK